MEMVVISPDLNAKLKLILKSNMSVWFDLLICKLVDVFA